MEYHRRVRPRAMLMVLFLVGFIVIGSIGEFILISQATVVTRTVKQ